MSSAIKITSAMVMKLLAAKHSKDTFVPECKDGPTHYNPHPLRMDAWVMRKSWAHPALTAYEVKVSRSDFLSDEKWPNYMPLCNRLYFVAPKDVISKDEVPSECGLLEVSKNCKRLVTKKKAPHREIEFPADVFRYVMMCRTLITRERTAFDRHAEWQEWLKQKREKQETGQMVRFRLGEMVSAKVGDIEKRNSKLENDIGKYKVVEEVMQAAGIDSASSWNIRRNAERVLLRGVETEAGDALRTIRDAVEKALALLPEKDA